VQQRDVLSSRHNITHEEINDIIEYLNMKHIRRDDNKHITRI
jgi:hypothetical protein